MTKSAVILPLAAPVLDGNGRPVSGAQMWAYDAGTTTLAALWYDQAGTSAAPNGATLVTDAAGRFADLWANPGYLTIELRMPPAIAGQAGALIRSFAKVTVGGTDNALALGGRPAADVLTALDRAEDGLADIPALRLLTAAYTGELVQLRAAWVAGDNAGGVFRLRTGDTTSADNGGTIIVDAAARRWERLSTAPCDPRWWGAQTSTSANADDAPCAAALAEGIRTGRGVRFAGTYHKRACLVIDVSRLAITFDGVTILQSEAVLVPEMATTLASATGPCAIHWRSCEDVQVSGALDILGQGVAGTTRLCGMIADTSTRLNMAGLDVHVQNMALGLFGVHCTDLILPARRLSGRDIRGYQTFESSGTSSAGSVLVIANCVRPVCAAVVAVENGLKPPVYLSIASANPAGVGTGVGGSGVTSDMRLGGVHIDNSSADADTEAAGLAIRACLGLQCGPVTGTGTTGLYVERYAGDATITGTNAIDDITVASVSVTRQGTAASTDAAIYLATADAVTLPLGTVTVGTARLRGTGETLVYMDAGTLAITGDLDLGGASTRHVQLVNAARVRVDGAIVTDAQATSQAISVGPLASLGASRLIVTGAKPASASTYPVRRENYSSGTRGRVDIAHVHFDVTTGWTHALLDLDTQAASQSNVGRVTGADLPLYLGTGGTLDTVYCRDGSKQTASQPLNTWPLGSVVMNSAPAGNLQIGWVRLASGWQGLGLPVFTGAGSPETVVTAPAGSQYISTTDGTRYRKSSGTGNTGWVTP